MDRLYETLDAMRSRPELEVLERVIRKEVDKLRVENDRLRKLIAYDNGERNTKGIINENHL